LIHAQIAADGGPSITELEGLNDIVFAGIVTTRIADLFIGGSDGRLGVERQY
jgi:hypothetical protein